MTGKWHLGHEADALPSARGFERSFALDASGADNWAQKAYLPIYDGAPWFEDGEPTTLPEDFYSSRFLVDRMIDYIDSDADQEAPFFAYLAFQAVHIPVQAPAEFIEHYRGRYDAGWDALRSARFKAVVARGLVPASTELGPMPPGLSDWSDLSAAERRLHARSMEVNAGMLEAMDHHLGRLVEHLKRQGRFENTVFVVLSDNGPEPNDPTDTPGFGLWLRWAGYSRDPETLGGPGTYAFIGPEFASADAAPGAFFKLYAGEGGLRVPLIIAGPGVPEGVVTRSFAFITDIAPTLLEMAAVGEAQSRSAIRLQPMTGRSLTPVLNAPEAPLYAAHESVAIEAAGNAAVFKGDFKLVRNMPPLGDGQWRLYDFARDPGETRDLSAELPARRAELLADYAAYADRVGVLEVPEGYQQMRQLAANLAHDLRQRYGGLVVGVLLVLVGTVWLGWRRRSSAN
ncbi:MAG: sulfatase-like hydrolase/transferase [Pseudomonadales bacterium]